MDDWSAQLQFFQSDTWAKIQDFLVAERIAGKSILPAPGDIFNAFKVTRLDDTKVVILGQDPYPNKRHAHGMAFSIPQTTKDIPKSLQNIFKELKADLNIEATHGNLENWAKQGVLLLNTALTVEAGNANSHRNIGWKELTKETLSLISQLRPVCVFILWGNKAQSYKKYITNPNHLIIESPHPSPLSSYRGFFGSKCFSRANTYLKTKGEQPINWKP